MTCLGVFLVACAVWSASAVANAAEPGASGDLCAQRIAGLDLTLLVDECNACVVSMMDTQTKCVYNPATRKCSATASGLDVRSRAAHCEMLTPPALMLAEGVWGQHAVKQAVPQLAQVKQERKRDDLEVYAAAAAVTSGAPTITATPVTPTPNTPVPTTPAPPTTTAPPSTTSTSTAAATAPPTIAPVAGLACDAYVLCGQCNDDVLTGKACTWCDAADSTAHGIGGQCVASSSACPATLQQIFECPADEADDVGVGSTGDSGDNDGAEGIVGDGAAASTAAAAVDPVDGDDGADDGDSLSTTTLALIVGGGVVCLGACLLALIAVTRKRRSSVVQMGGGASTPPHQAVYGDVSNLRSNDTPRAADNVYDSLQMSEQSIGHYQGQSTYSALQPLH